MIDDRKVAGTCPLAQWTHSKGSDTRPSFVAFTEGKYGDPTYACQGCHEKGSMRELLMFLWTKGRDTYHWIELLDEGVTIEEALVESERQMKSFTTANRQGFATRSIDRPEQAAPIPQVGTDGRPFYDYKCLEEADAVPEIPWEEFEPHAKSIPKYALDRGLTIETCKEWELGHDKKGKRLLFPIRNRKGVLVAISGRLYATDCVRCGGEWVTLCSECGDAEDRHNDDDHQFTASRKTCVRCGTAQPPKYLHRKGFKRNLLLYGEHRVQDETDGRVYVVEGHLDMMKMWQAGYRPVVAVLGSGIGEPQVEKLIAHWGEGHIIAVPDGNAAGRDMVRRFKHLLADRVRFTAKELPEGRDPGDMTAEELRELLGAPPFKTTA